MAPIREKQKVLHTNNLNAKQTMIAAQLATILNNFYKTFQMSFSRTKEKNEEWEVCEKISPCFVFCCSGFTRSSECIFQFVQPLIMNRSFATVFMMLLLLHNAMRMGATWKTIVRREALCHFHEFKETFSTVSLCCSGPIERAGNAGNDACKE